MATENEREQAEPETPWDTSGLNEDWGADAENMALCAMAETLWARRNDGLASTSVGSVTVHYADDQPSLTRALYEKAAIYLDIYRGVQ